MSLRINEVATAAGVHRETLRYYERRGLLRPPARSAGGHRLYDVDAVRDVRTIKAAQRLGFSLDEVADLLTASRRGHRGAGLQARAREKLREIDCRIADLVAIRDSLHAAIEAGCDDLHACATSDCCPLSPVDVTVQPRHTPRRGRTPAETTLRGATEHP